MRKIAHWLECYSEAMSLDILRDLALSHSREGGIQGAYISSLIVAGDFKALCDYELDYGWSGWTIHHLIACRQALAFFSKLEFLDIGVDKEKVALEKFRQAEALCRETNVIFQAWSRGEFNFSPRVDAVLFAAQRKIAHVLGNVPSLERLKFRFGPGATTLTKKRDANALEKLSAGVACSEDLALMAGRLLGEMPAWADCQKSVASVGGLPVPPHSGAPQVEPPASSEQFVFDDRDPILTLLTKRQDAHDQRLKNEALWAGFPKYGFQADWAPSDDETDANWQKLHDRLEAEPGHLVAKQSNDKLEECSDGVQPSSTDPCDVSVPVQIMDAALTFVAKNAKTYRAIATEPPLNGVYQLALGDYIARRLAKFGVDLSDQSRNQRLAKEGSLTGALATLDLSSASDTVATELVYHLLPVDWALALSVGRSSAVLYKGEKIVLEKFSSMGNGFTFALESLIFWALASSCSAGGEVSVYGDDIIVETAAVPLLTEVLTACGFTLSPGKSFSTGPFRESCGADYYRGFDIRPYYQKDLVCPADLMKLHNFYVRHGYEERAEMVRKTYLHPDFHIFGPDGYGDGHLLGDFSPLRKQRHVRSGYSGFVFDTFKEAGLRMDRKGHLPGDYVYSLYTIYQRASEPLVKSLGRLGSHLGAGDYARAHGCLEHLARGRTVGEAVPEVTLERDGERWSFKTPSVPGSRDYKRISIYTLK